MSNDVPELDVALGRLAGVLTDGAAGLTEAVGIPVQFGPATGEQIVATDSSAGPLLRVHLNFSAGLTGTASMALPSSLVEALTIDPESALSVEDLHGGEGLSAARPLLETLVAACVRSLTTSQGTPVEATISKTEWCDRLPEPDIDDSHLILEYPAMVAGRPQGSMFLTIDVPLAAGLALSCGEPTPAALGTGGSPPSALVNKGSAGLGALADVQLSVSVELGQTQYTVKEVLSLREGSVIRLRRHVGDNVDLMVNGTIAARGDVVVVNGKLGLRVQEVVDRA